MKKRSNSDFILSGGLWWNENNISHSLNLLISKGVQLQSGVYSKFGLMTYKDKSYKLGWYKWSNTLNDMLGGSPSLIIDNKIHIDSGKMENYILTSKQPRAGFGLNKDHVFLVTVDGRKEGRIGATIQEFANIMKDLKCENAFGGDGGGTVRLEDKSKVLNYPTENRSMNNAISIKLKEV